ncbi:hypothetical protein [Nitratifractor salsuginis]|uniref:Cytochrome c domain-containing protein n=1 Tax=Nitratifractor salsuginis (strain DSM 16511 / JCM 12458 / E9I37-1) TaxID=749222 RepID=E6X007_NITSE|nr:hypothetical protein [Nitratifractor salsuginis]ADV46730.1 hypothetical protein Nitsa_1482 [Nitratifractor salsuginis DSM 16511]
MNRWRFTLVLVLGLSGMLSAGSFDRNCVPCHRKEGVSLRKTFMNALLIYSGEHNMKAGLKYFLRHPSKETSVMGEEYFKNHRLMPPSTLSDRELEEALDEYWERYKVIGRLR